MRAQMNLHLNNTLFPRTLLQSPDNTHDIEMLADGRVHSLYFSPFALLCFVLSCHCFSKLDIDGFNAVYKVNGSWKSEIFAEFVYKLQRKYFLHSNS